MLSLTRKSGEAIRVVIDGKVFTVKVSNIRGGKVRLGIDAQRKPLVDPPNQLDAIIQECNELISIFVKSGATAQENMKKQ